MRKDNINDYLLSYHYFFLVSLVVAVAFSAEYLVRSIPLSVEFITDNL